MKKTVILLILLLSVCRPVLASYDDGYTDKGVLAREWTVMSRGLMNFLGSPFEVPRTISSEAEMHKWIWPVTVWPRLLTNIGQRGASALNDLLLYPWAVPFMHDIAPWTDHFGLPEYPWNME